MSTTMVNIGNIEEVYLSSSVADMLLSEVDGIKCLAMMVGYEVEFTFKPIMEVDKNRKIAMSFYKDDEFLFELVFTFNAESKIVHDVCLFIDDEVMKNKDVHHMSETFGLKTSPFFSWIKVKDDEDFDPLFKFIKVLI